MNEATTIPITAASNSKLSLRLASGRTDAANAKRLAQMHGDDVHWCDRWNRWQVWDGRRWANDDVCQVESFAKSVAESVWADVGKAVEKADEKTSRAIYSFAKSTASANGVRNMLAMLRSEPGIAITPDVLDSNPWRLNLANGDLDLRTGVLRKPNRDDYCTKISPVAFDPSAECPTWHDYLAVVMPDAEMREYLKRLVGYSITGSTREHVLPFLYGTGANGKSVFLATILSLLGTDYAIKASADLLLAKTGGHPTEVADLFGRRFVACIEAEDGRRLAESLVKELTGGDRLRARRMREDFWEFSPTHKIWLAANHKPTVRGTDHGIWRRIKMIPFTVVIPPENQDRELPEKLVAELPGILNWALAGCMEWLAGGLAEPKSVTDATGAYRDEMDLIGAFIATCCVVSENATAGATAIYQAYLAWCNATREKAVSQTRFGEALTERGFGTKRTAKGKVREGIGLAAIEGSGQ